MSAAGPAPEPKLLERRGRVGSLTCMLVDIVLHRNAKAASVRSKVAAAVGVNADDVNITGNKVRLTVAARRLPQLADIDEVRHIERVSLKKLDNDVAP
jgi:hypothetical protein